MGRLIDVPKPIYNEAKELQKRLRAEQGVNRPLWECVSIVRDNKKRTGNAMSDVLRGFGL